MNYYIISDQTNNVTRIILIDGNIMTSFIENTENTDYQMYKLWLEEGNTPLPWPPTEGGV